MRNVKKFLKRTNPYMVGSVVIVVITICLIVWLIFDGTKGEEIPLPDTIVKVETNETEQKAEKEVIFVSETESQVIEDVLIIQAAVSPVEETQKVTETVLAEEVYEEKAEAISPVTTSEPTEEVSEPVKEEPEQSKSDAPKVSEPEQEELKISEPTPEPEPPVEIKPEPEQPEIIEPSSEPDKECNHSFIFDSYYQEPTCSSGGLEIQVCVHCGMSQTTSGTPTGEHSFITETKGDCVSEEVIICENCNYRETGSKNPGNHIDVEDGFCYGCGTKLH